jgi:DNA-binding NarL/FixJ family response regulator
MIPMHNIKVGIIEKNRLLREYMTTIVKSQSAMSLAFSSSTADQMLLKSADVVLCQWDVFRNIIIRDANPHSNGNKFIITNTDSQQIDIAQCIRFGATGFTLPDTSPEQYESTIFEVIKGKWVVPEQTALCLYFQLADQSNHKMQEPLCEILTNRERQVIRLINDGMTNKEIAGTLNIAVDTVKSHVHNILEKLNLPSRMHIMKHSMYMGNSV